jgi:hypothetical protein
MGLKLAMAPGAMMMPYGPTFITMIQGGNCDSSRATALQSRFRCLQGQA